MIGVNAPEAPIIIVGTHKDKIADRKEQEEISKHIVEKL